MKLNTLILLIATLILFLIGSHTPGAVFGATGGLSEAQVTKQYGVTFPVTELNNCGSIAECGAYCRKDGNLPSCMKFVNTHQLTKADVLSFNISELGNCQIGSDCRNFCNRDENIAQCIDFADKYDLLSPSNIEISRAFTKAIGSGGTPGGCRTLEECNSYCDSSSHTNECLDYVGKKKLVVEEQLSAARKVAEGFRQGIETPGKCRGITECDDYCIDEAHFNECAVYAQKVGFYPSEIEAGKAGKFIAMATQGVTPGGCKSKEACDAYCAIATHGVECTDFAVSAGLLSKDEAEASKKYGGAGPGGCKSKDECSTFCDQPANQDTCLQYAKEHNIPIDFKGPGGCSDQASCTAYCQQHTDNPECQKMGGQYGGTKGPGGCSDEASCKEYCMKNSSDAECQKMAGQYGGMKGPGGCNSMESCTSYCKSNPKDAECAQYAGSAGQYGGFSGPGGCSDEASCTSYCESNPKDSACAPYVGQYGGGKQ
ncbi:MAG: hypothetical protein Q8P92_02950 [Candidatus Daviesbacteria bacterium]|nr:hypothetical protein [Candidatus Daviesbacteria bacterium]